MIKKEDAIAILRRLVDPNNEGKIRSYLDKINNMTEGEWEEFLRAKSITNIGKMEELAKLLVRIDTEEHIQINELISYGISGTTLHIHVVPKDLHHMLSPNGLRQGEQYLIEALEQIKEMLQSEEFARIDKVFAVSPIMRRPITDVFERLMFSTRTIKMEDAKNDDELQGFYNMFQGTGKKLGRAILTRQQLFSEEWQRTVNSRKRFFKGDDVQEL